MYDDTLKMSRVRSTSKKAILAKFLEKKITVIPSEKEAIHYAIENAQKGALIVLWGDVVPDALELVKNFKEKEQKNNTLVS